MFAWASLKMGFQVVDRVPAFWSFLRSESERSDSVQLHCETQSSDAKRLNRKIPSKTVGLGITPFEVGAGFPPVVVGNYTKKYINNLPWKPSESGGGFLPIVSQ